MENKEGVLRITKLVKNIIVNNEKYIFDIDIDSSFNGQKCFFDIVNDEVIKIEIDGKTFKLEKKCKTKNNLKIPNDTCIIIENQTIENFHLKLNKFAKFDEEKGYKLQNQNINENFFDSKDWGDFYQKNIESYYENIQNLNLNFSDPIELKTSYRLLIGSEQSIYETSIRLHHIYGIPYIPASAIKGVVRSYIILECFADELEKYKDKYNKFEEEVLFKCNWFVDIFGSQDQEGKIIFFDTFPTTKPIIKVDIMNPHYGDYYKDKDNKKKIAPTDTENPVPINFLTVENTTFEFFIASKKKIDESFIKLFKEALTEHGIGVKTAVGYGYLEEAKK